MLFFLLPINQRILENTQLKYTPENHSFHKKKSAAQLFSSLIIIRNVSWASNHHIRMISEGSCDAEDWSNDAEISALHHRNLQHIHRTVLLNCNSIWQYYWIFDQINAVLLSRRDFFQKQISYQPQMPEKVCYIIQYSLHVQVWFIELFIYTQIFPVSAVTLRDHNCRGEFNGSHFLLLFPVISCGTEGEMDEVNGRVHYTNTVRDTLFNTIIKLVYVINIISVPDEMSCFKHKILLCNWNSVIQFN